MSSKMGSKMGSNRVPKVAIPFEREAKKQKSASLERRTNPDHSPPSDSPP